MKQPDISVVIVSYNTQALLKSCLLSLQEQEGVSLEIVVVDNNSHDGSPAMVQKTFPKVHLIANKDNQGFSKANNTGIKKTQGRYLLFLNPDTVVPKTTLRHLVERMDTNTSIGAVTAKVLLPDGTLDDACHRGFPTPWNAFCHFSGLAKVFPTSRVFAGYSLGWMDLTTPHVIDACAGACMLVRREAGEEVGWWDEDFFWYGEDLDFCYRLKGAGWPVYFQPDVTILHYKGVAGGIKSVSQHMTTASQETKRRATYARFEAMRIFYKKHYTKKYPALFTTIVFQGINLLQRRALKAI